MLKRIWHIRIMNGPTSHLCDENLIKRSRLPRIRASLRGPYILARELPMSLPHVCLYVCVCVHGTAEPLDGVVELPDTQTSQQTNVNET